MRLLIVALMAASIPATSEASVLSYLRQIWAKPQAVCQASLKVAPQPTQAEVWSGEIDYSIPFPREITDLAWREQTMNGGAMVHKVRVDPAVKNVSYSLVDKNSFVVRSAGTLSPEIASLFDANGNVLWPKHPLQGISEVVPHSGDQPTGTLPGLLSASRSVFFNGFSIKLPLDATNKDKAMLQKSVIISLMRTRAIFQIDEQIGTDPGLVVLPDVLSIADKATGNGFVVRDLSPLLDGNDSYPGFAVERPLRAYAEKSGLPFDQVVREHFSLPFARSVALMLLRYGLVLNYPHDQNYIMRFEAGTGRPLDQVAWRDISDSVHVLDLMEPLGFGQLKEETLAQGFITAAGAELKIIENGYFIKFQNLGNKREIMDFIQMEFVRAVFEGLGEPYTDADLTIAKVSQFLLSPKGIESLKNYHQRLRQRHSQSSPDFQRAG